MKYYVDTRIGQVVPENEIDVSFLAPELYYEYRSTGTNDIIVETWQSESGLIDFSYLIRTKRPKGLDLDKERELHFKKYNVKPFRLHTYAVPEDWFNEATNKYQQIVE